MLLNSLLHSLVKCSICKFWGVNLISGGFFLPPSFCSYFKRKALINPLSRQSLFAYIM